jgi:hypothetical protein
LTEDGFAAAILFFHRLGRLIKVIEHLGLDWRDVGNHGPITAIYVEHGTTTWTGDLEFGWLSHAQCIIAQFKGSRLRATAAHK